MSFRIWSNQYSWHEKQVGLCVRQVAQAKVHPSTFSVFPIENASGYDPRRLQDATSVRAKGLFPLCKNRLRPREMLTLPQSIRALSTLSRAFSTPPLIDRIFLDPTVLHYRTLSDSRLEQAPQTTLQSFPSCPSLPPSPRGPTFQRRRSLHHKDQLVRLTMHRNKLPEKHGQKRSRLGSGGVWAAGVRKALPVLLEVEGRRRV